MPRLAASLAALGLALPACADSPAAPDFLGQIVIPTGLRLGGVEFGGISGLDHDPASGLFRAISDDRSERGPARFYELRLGIDDGGALSLDIVATHVLRDPAGAPFAGGDVDPEAIRFDPATTRIVWASEADRAGRPAIYVARPDGSGARALPLPEPYLPDAAGTRGVRKNQSIEGLALAGPGRVVAITENALVQDGPTATRAAGSLSRILVLDAATGAVEGEFAYLTDPVFSAPAVDGGFSDNGAADILALGGDRFAVLERAFVQGVGNRIAVYAIDLAGARNQAGAAVIADAPVAKTPWFTIDEGDFGGLDLDNIEALSFGPEIGGRRTLVLASDNNFNPDGQVTQFLVFTLPE